MDTSDTKFGPAPEEGDLLVALVHCVAVGAVLYFLRPPLVADDKGGVRTLLVALVAIGLTYAILPTQAVEQIGDRARRALRLNPRVFLH